MDVTKSRSLNPGQLPTTPLKSGEKRTHTRVAYALRALHSGREGFFLEDEIVNISRSGLLLRTPDVLSLAERIDLMLIFPERDEEYAVQGEVVRVEPCVFEREEKSPLLEVGVYIGFVEPSQKKLLERAFRSILNEPTVSQTPRELILGDQPRIRVLLDGPDAPSQAGRLATIAEKGLFIEVPEPISIFSKPRVRLVHPLTQEICDLTGEVTHTQVISSNRATGQSLYGIGVRFDHLSGDEQEKISRILASTDARKTPTA